MKVPEVIEKVLEKIREISDRPFLSEDAITISVMIDVQLDEDQYNELINMLKSRGYRFYKKGIDEQGAIMEIYNNNRTGEYISINYVKDKKYDIGIIIYYWDSESEHHEIYS